MSNQIESFGMPQKNLRILTKIILIYSLFYVGLKIAIVIQGAWLLANLIFAIPFVLLAMVGGYLLKTGKLSWIFAVAGILIIVGARYFEKDWIPVVHSYVG